MSEPKLPDKLNAYYYGDKLERSIPSPQTICETIDALIDNVEYLEKRIRKLKGETYEQ